MKYLLDTNACIYLLKRRPPDTLIGRFRAQGAGEIAVSTITLAELRVGAARSSNAVRNNEMIDGLLAPLAILDFDQAAAASFGSIKAAMLERGLVIGPLDWLIAAHALSRQLVLVTNNTGELERVPGLAVEDWTTDGSSKGAG